MRPVIAPGFPCRKEKDRVETVGELGQAEREGALARGGSGQLELLTNQARRLLFLYRRKMALAISLEGNEKVEEIVSPLCVDG